MTQYSKAIAALAAAVVVFFGALIATRDVDLALFAFASAAPVALGVLVAPANRSGDRGDNPVSVQRRRPRAPRIR